MNREVSQDLVFFGSAVVHWPGYEKPLTSSWCGDAGVAPHPGEGAGARWALISATIRCRFPVFWKWDAPPSISSWRQDLDAVCLWKVLCSSGGQQTVCGFGLFLGVVFFFFVWESFLQNLGKNLLSEQNVTVTKVTLCDGAEYRNKVVAQRRVLFRILL